MLRFPVLDCRNPCFRNFESTVSIDVIRIKTFVDGLFNLTIVPVWVTINKLNLVNNWKDTARSFLAVLKTGRFGYEQPKTLILLLEH